MYRFFFRLIVIGFLGMFVAPVPVPAADDAVETESAPGEKERTVRVGFFAFKGFHEQNAEGERSGFGYDYLQYLSVYAPWRYEYVGYDKSWSEMLQMLESGEIDLLGSAQKTPERMEKFDFSETAMGFSSVVLAVNAGDMRFAPGDYANWNGMTVGMLRENSRNQAFAEFARENRFSFSPVFFEDSAALSEALQKASVDAVLSSNLRRPDGEWVLASFAPSPFYIMVRKGNRALLDEMDQAMRELRRNSPDLPDRLWSRYYRMHSAELIHYTPEEIRFIEEYKTQNQVFNAVILPNRFPLSYCDGKVEKGISAELAQMILQRTGLRFNLIETRTVAEYAALLKSDAPLIQLDAPHDFYQAEQYGMKLTQPYLNGTVSRLSRSDFSGEPRRVGVLQFGGFGRRMIPLTAAKASQIAYNTLNEAVAALKNGQIDALYLDTRVAEALARKDDLNHLVSTIIPGSDCAYAIGVRYPDYPQLRAVLNKAVLSMPPDESMKIEAKYDSLSLSETHFIRMVLMHPEWFAGLLGVGILFIAGMLGIYLWSRHRVYRQALFIRKLPLHFFVFDHEGRILLYSLGEHAGLRYPNMRLTELNDIPERSVHEMMLEEIHNVFLSGQMRTFTFKLGGRFRTAQVSRLPSDYFGCDAVLWLSQDSDDLQNAQLTAQAEADRFLLTLKAIGEGVIVTDADARVQLVNDEACRILGMEENRLKNQPLSSFFCVRNASDESPVPLLLYRVLMSGEAVKAEEHAELLIIGSRRIYIAQSAAPIRNRDGVIVGGVLVFRDVSEIFAQREQLHAHSVKLGTANSLWDTVINAVPFLFFAKDPENGFRYVMANKAMSDFIKLPLSSILNKNDSELFGHGNPAARSFSSEDDAAMSCPGGKIFEEDIYSDDGVLSHLSTIKKPFVAADGKRMLLGAGFDNTKMFRLVNNAELTANILRQISEENDFEINLNRISEFSQRYLQCDRMIVNKLDPDGQLRIYSEWVWNGEPHVSDWSKLHALWNTHLEQFKSTQLLVFSDLQNSGLVTEDIQMRTKSLIIAPIYVQNTFWGAVFICYTSHVRVFSDLDRDIMRTIANVISLACLQKSQLDKIQNADYEKQVTLNTVKIPIWLYNGEGKLLRVNTAVCNMLEESEESILHAEKTLCERIDEAPGAVSSIRRVRETFCPVKKEISYNGREYLIYSEPVFGRNGELINIVQSAVDVTDLNRMIKNENILNQCMKILLATEENQEAAASAVLELICTYIQADRFYLIRHDYESMRLKVEYEYAREKHLSVRKNFEDQTFLETDVWFQMLSSGNSLRISDLDTQEIDPVLDRWVPLYRELAAKSLCISPIQQGKQLWGSVEIVYNEPHKFSDNEITFVQSLSRLLEIMLERNRNRQRVFDALSKARAADRAKTYFLASMSHEIRTPLNAVIGFSDLLKDESLDRDTQKEYVDCISHAGTSLLELINDVLDLSKLEAGQMTFKEEPIAFDELCRDVGRIFQSQLNAKLLKCLFAIAPVPVFFSDPLRLRQILFNLIGNAVKFTRKGSITVSGRFLFQKEDRGTLVFSISDTGIGVPEKDQPTLFNLFSQANTSAVRGTHAGNEGTGLGLALVQRLLLHMNGDISLESEVGKGSRFTVTLRDVRFDPKTAENNDCDLKAESIENVLLVDDLEIDVNFLAGICRKCGLSVQWTLRPREALNVIRKRPVDCVMMNVYLNDMNGLDFARELKMIYPRMPLIGLSDLEDLSEAEESGLFFAVYHKPVSVAVIRDCLAKFSKKS